MGLPVCGEENLGILLLCSLSSVLLASSSFARLSQPCHYVALAWGIGFPSEPVVVSRPPVSAGCGDVSRCRVLWASPLHVTGLLLLFFITFLFYYSVSFHRNT